jgi:DNA-binding HxlR family transcriptional regulator/putative sterol carrier protein
VASIDKRAFSLQARYAFRVTDRRYGQYCGLAYALDLVGERWALLIVRDLLMAPKRFTELERGLPGIPSNVLAARLKELEQNGIVARHVAPRPEAGVVYDLTDYGRELEEIVLRLGRWGARSLGEPKAGDVVTPAALVVALRAGFRPGAARGLRATYELRVGDVVVHARVAGGRLEAGEGPADAPDVVVESDATLKRVMAGELTLDEALAGGRFRVEGDRALLDRFAEAFVLPGPREPAAAAR